MKKPSVKDRIRAAYKITRQYHEMMAIVFPEPSAHRYATGGGPPVCAMNFGKALREMGGSSAGMGSTRKVWLPSEPEKP